MIDWTARTRELGIAIADLTHNHGTFPHTCPMAEGWTTRIAALAAEAYQAGRDEHFESCGNGACEAVRAVRAAMAAR